MSQAVAVLSSMVRDKVRIRFRKAGELRLVSHHDLMRCFERMLRRATLPFHSTQGFNPKPRLVFALSLALGIVGCEEVVELELDDELPPEAIHHRLAAQAPAGLEFLSVRRIPVKLTAQVRRVTYRIKLSTNTESDLASRTQTLLAQPECWVERPRPEPPRRINVRPYLDNLRLSLNALELDLFVTPTGTARPDEIIHLLGLTPLLEQGAILERSRMELHDETPPGSVPQATIGEALSASLGEPEHDASSSPSPAECALPTTF